LRRVALLSLLFLAFPGSASALTPPSNERVGYDRWSLKIDGKRVVLN
jgi:hypothetical protein